MNERIINKRGLELIKRFEGIEDGNPLTVNLDPYLDPVEIWTIGWGHALKDKTGHFIRGKENNRLASSFYPNGLTLEQAEELLLADTLATSKALNTFLPMNLTSNQFSALVSFAFNVGVVNLKLSMMNKLIQRGEHKKAAEQFGKWIYATKKGIKVVLPGLVRRREAEKTLWLDADE